MANATPATVGFIVSGAVTLASLVALAALSGTFAMGDSDVSDDNSAAQSMPRNNPQESSKIGVPPPSRQTNGIPAAQSTPRNNPQGESSKFVVANQVFQIFTEQGTQKDLRDQYARKSSEALPPAAQSTPRNLYGSSKVVDARAATFDRKLRTLCKSIATIPVSSSLEALESLVVDPLVDLMECLHGICYHRGRDRFVLARDRFKSAVKVLQEAPGSRLRAENISSVMIVVVALLEGAMELLKAAGDTCNDLLLGEIPGAIRTHYARLLESQSNRQRLHRRFKKNIDMAKNPVVIFQSILGTFNPRAVAHNATNAETAKMVRDADIGTLLELVELLQEIDGPFVAHFDANKAHLLARLRIVMDDVGASSKGQNASATVFAYAWQEVNAARTPADLDRVPDGILSRYSAQKNTE